MSTTTAIDTNIQRALVQRDLTQPVSGPHAMQQLITAAHTTLAERWSCQRQLQRGSALVHMPSSLFGQDLKRIGRNIAPTVLLRPRTRIHLPELLSSQALNPPEDLLLICPGVVYRRSPLTPLHDSEPHQLDLWRLQRGRLSTIELADMLQTVLAAVLPEHRYRLLPASRPHLVCGMRIELATAAGWLNIGHAGLLTDSVLATAGLEPSDFSALGMTLGLDRVLMQRKGIPHIRLLRSDAPAIAEQMLDLQPYRPLHTAPALTRELQLSETISDCHKDLADCLRRLPARQLAVIESAELLDDHMLRLSLCDHEQALSEQDADAIGKNVLELIDQAAARQPAPFQARKAASLTG